MFIVKAVWELAEAHQMTHADYYPVCGAFNGPFSAAIMSCHKDNGKPFHTDGPVTSRLLSPKTDVHVHGMTHPLR